MEPCYPHFEAHIRPNGFKAQLVAVDRDTAVTYKEELDKLNGPTSAVIYSASRGDTERLANYHTTKAEQDKLIARFKNPSDPLALLIVVEMLLTGFDAPIEQVLYLDAPLKEHNLLQAIARVNRPYRLKDFGLIVDYWGVSGHRQSALMVFDSEELGEPMEPTSSELPRLEARHQRLMRMFAGFGHDDLDALLRKLEPEDERAKFNQAFRAFSESLNRVYPSPEALRFEPDYKWLGKVRHAAHNRFRDPDLAWDVISPKLRQLIDEHVSASGITTIVEPVSILSPEFEERLEHLGTEEARASEIAHAMQHEISVRESENPVFYASLKERLEALIRARRDERLDQAEQLRQLYPLWQELKRGAQNEAQALGLTETLYAFYQQLGKREVNVDLGVTVAKEMEAIIGDLVVIDWTIKDVAALQATTQQVLQIATGTMVLSGLNLAVSAAGFAFINRKLNRLQSQLGELQKDV